MEHLIPCRKCGKRVTPSKLKISSDPKKTMCLDCARSLKEAKEAELNAVENQVPEKRRRRYKCQKCKHIVLIKDGFNKQCSFCGGNNLIAQEWNSDLDALIKESGQKIYDN